MVDIAWLAINGYRILGFDKNLCSHGVIVGEKLISRRPIKLFACSGDAASRYRKVVKHINYDNPLFIVDDCGLICACR